MEPEGLEEKASHPSEPLWMERYLGLTLTILLGTLLSIGSFLYLLQGTLSDREDTFTLNARLEEERIRTSLQKHASHVRELAEAVKTSPRMMYSVGTYLFDHSEFTSMLLMEETKTGINVAEAIPVTEEGGLPVEIPEQVASIAASLRALKPDDTFILPLSDTRLLLAAAVETKPRRYVLGIVNMNKLLTSLLDADQAWETSIYLYMRHDGKLEPVAAYEKSNLFDFISTKGKSMAIEEMRRYSAFTYESTLKLLDEEFIILISPTPAFLGKTTTYYPWIVLGLGFVLTSLAGALIFSLIGRNNEIRTTVLRRTRELRLKATELQDARVRAEEASSAKSEFLANMSHEIRTPLNAITGLVQILGRSEPLTVQQRTFIHHLQSSSQALFELISDILDLSKIESRDFALDYTPFAFDGMLREMEQMLLLRAKEKNLVLIVDLSGIEGLHYLGDKARLRQVLLNLVNNAIKFTEKGSVTVRAYVRGADDRMVIEVSDTGIGIPPEKQALIFEKFSQADNSITRRFGGTGLGLHISRQLITLMNGEIRLASEPGLGSTFIINLPLRLVQPAAPDAPQPATLEPDPLIKAEHGRILLVEDFDSNIMVATLMLKELGYACEVAQSGLIALEKFAPDRFDAVLMDVQMPGMDGFETTRRIRNFENAQKLEAITIIGLTAHAIAEYRDKCFEAGMDDFMTKPFTLDDLRRRLGEFNRDEAA